MTGVRDQLTDAVALYPGDCIDVLKTLEANSIDACVTDPPYGLSFMGKAWDHGVPGILYWKVVYRVLKPGAHLFAFGGTRTYHRMACAIEDAGFEVRDSLMWIYGSGFPKSHDVSKAIDKRLGAEREVIAPPPYSRGRASQQYSDTRRVFYDYPPQPITAPGSDCAAEWAGWGTALKPAFEPIILARKPLCGTVAENVLRYGTGALNIDACRVAMSDADMRDVGRTVVRPEGRWPANVLTDGSAEAIEGFPDSESGGYLAEGLQRTHGVTYGKPNLTPPQRFTSSEGSASRFFYTAKADSDDRLGSKHPTVKPIDLMQWLVRLVCRKGGTVLDPFAGTGTTGEAAFREGMRAVLIEREAEYCDDIRRRMKLAMAGPQERCHESIKAKTKGKPKDYGPLFGGTDTPPTAQADKFTECSPTKADASGNSA